MSTSHAADRHDRIRVQGARVHNLRDVDVLDGLTTAILADDERTGAKAPDRCEARQ